jgi:single-strand DNA-binding protein
MSNLVIIKGRLSQDVELKYTQTNNTAVANFSVAVNRKFTQEGQPTADFFNVTAWGKTGEFVQKYFSKGQEIYIQGHLQNRSWEVDGQKRYATDIIAEQVEFCGSKKQQETAFENQFEGTDTTVDILPF